MAADQTFIIGDIFFRCFVVSDGEASVRYEWRTDDGRCRIGRNLGNAMCWAEVDGRKLGSHYVGLKPAMLAASHFAKRRAA